MKIKLLNVSIFIFCYFSVNAQSSTEFYKNAFTNIDSMLLNTKQLLFKEAVFYIEDAFFDNQLSHIKYESEIQTLVKLTQTIHFNNPITYSQTDKDVISKNAALCRLITDTIPITLDSTHIAFHKPFTYDFNDMWGEKDWRNIFVSKLLEA